MSDLQADWEDQRAFLAVLETGSLSAAARRLGVAQPTVRHRIEALERFLDVILFTRSVNGLVATDQAEALGPHIRAMAMASQAFVRTASAPPGAIAGTVRLSVPEMVGVEILPSMLAPLRTRHPDLMLEIALSNEAADIFAREADIAVRMQRPKQQALVAQHVGAIPLGLFAHRDYVDRRGVPTTAADLAAFDLIGSDRSAADLAFVASLHPSLDARLFAIRTDSHPAQLAAVRAGLGIGVVQRPLALRDPALRPVLADLVLPPLETWIVLHEDVRRVPRMRAVFDHLVREFSRYAKSGL